MRDARYMHLISWTLQSGSEQFIYNWNQTHTDQTKELAERNGQRTRQQRKQTDGNTSRVKSTRKPSRQENHDNGIKRMGLQVVSKVTRKTKSLYTKKIVYSVRGGLAPIGSSLLCGYIQMMEKPTKVKALQ